MLSNAKVLNSHSQDSRSDRIACDVCGHVFGYDHMTWGRFCSYEPAGPVCIKCSKQPGFVGDADFSPSGLKITGQKLGEWRGAASGSRVRHLINGKVVPQ